MSTHPNAILLLVLTPDGLARRTMREILVENQVKMSSPEEEEEDEEYDSFQPNDHQIKIGGYDYTTLVMEEDYYESQQIAAKAGDLCFYDFITYGYGERISWSALEAQKTALETWAKETCAKHACRYAIFVTANYW